MKKTLSIASLLAMILSVAIFTSCSEPEPYTGKFYNTEYVKNIPDDEYKQNWEKKDWETQKNYLATWPSKKGYEKKTNLKDYEVVSYLKSKIPNLSDEKVQEVLLKLGTNFSSCFYNITDEEPGSSHDILFLTIAE